MRRRSSKGNPNHWPAGTPKGGQFAPKGAGHSYFRDDDYYEARTKFRNGEISREEMDAIKNEYASPQEMEQLFGKRFGSENFVPAKSVKEAADYCRSLGVQPYYNGLSLETCNALNESLTVTFENFPKTREKVIVCGNAQDINRAKKAAITEYIVNGNFGYFRTEASKKEWVKGQASRIVGRVGGRSLAFVQYGARTVQCAEVEKRFNGVYINSNQQDITASMEYGVGTKFHPKGCGSVKAVMDHEMGHLIHNTYGGLKVNMKDKTIKDELSEYGASDVKEYHAEAWSEFCNNPNPRRRAREVAEEFFRRAK